MTAKILKFIKIPKPKKKEGIVKQSTDDFGNVTESYTDPDTGTVHPVVGGGRIDPWGLGRDKMDRFSQSLRKRQRELKKSGRPPSPMLPPDHPKQKAWKEKYFPETVTSKKFKKKKQKELKSATNEVDLQRVKRKYTNADKLKIKGKKK